MTFFRRAILFVLCLPMNLIVGWPVILFVRAAWGANLRWELAPGSGGLPALTCDLKPDSWPARTWYKNWGATTLGHAIFYAPGIRDHADDMKVLWATEQEHEHIHVEEFEGAMAAHALLGLLLFFSLVGVNPVAAVVCGFSVWILGWGVFVMGGWLAALLRGEPVYSGSAHEEAARAQAGPHG
jgi:hypothetical protein